MNYSTEETRVYRILLARASTVSAPLADAITSDGPVPSQRANYRSIGHFLARAIIGQQLSARVARSIWERVTIAASSATMNVPAFTESYADEVRTCGVSTNKIRALQSVRAAERVGTLCETKLQELGPREQVATLLGIHGVGPWTCDMALIFYYHLPDIWPEGDAAVQRMFARLIGRRKPKPTAARFSPHRSSLALIMWRMVDAGY